MFGNLFEEDDSSVPNIQYYSSVERGYFQYGKGKKSQTKALEPPAPREFTKLSGISNQGGTCYLNSLLQTLHFTPEFREALFSIGPEELGSLEDMENPDTKVRIIPLQLQRLFAQLLLLDQEAASTEDLTNSFGWTCNEEMRQHDVQELNRILFSALETSLVGTSGHDLINRLYHGTIVNQIVCKECQNVSEKQEDFLDLTVAVKNISSLEDALWNMYVEEEVFEHDNLYQCGACERLVTAAKSAKLRKLPPFLTVSLLRFNFDFVKCKRYKETSRYTFPLQINLKPFCEQSELDDVDYMYDLFSVIIHKGDCYEGHYHVYIKDVDHLGNWQFQEEKSKPDMNLNEKEIDDPLMILKAILLEEENNQIPVYQLGHKILKKIGVSWNQKFKKQAGPLRKFLQLHSQTFLLSSDTNTVSLLKNQESQPESTSQRPDLQGCKTLPSESLGVKDPGSCPHWFDINDSKVQPIEEKDIEQQFQGKESAYMLFYRKSQLQRPSEAYANPRFGVPCHLLREMDTANMELQTKRAESESTSNSVKLCLHLGTHYMYSYDEWALCSITSKGKSVWNLTFDQRKTLGDLRQSVLKLFEFWEGDMVLSVAKSTPVGLHVCRNLHGDDLTLSDLGITDHANIFVWNGMEVGGVPLPVGYDCEPLLLNIVRLCEDYRWESMLIIAGSADLGAVSAARDIPLGIVFINTESMGQENWTLISKRDMRKTLLDLGLRSGNSILFQDAVRGDYRLLSERGGWSPPMDEINGLLIKNMCPLHSERQEVELWVSSGCVVFDIRIKAIKELKFMKELADNSCLRPYTKDGKLLCPVPEECTVWEAKLRLGSTLGLCPGSAPAPSQLFLFFIVVCDVLPNIEKEIIVEETVSVRTCIKMMLKISGLRGDNWHLRELDWCDEAGEPLSDEDALLKDLMIGSGDTLLLIHGNLPPPRFLKVSVWWYEPRNPYNHWSKHQNLTSYTPSHIKIWDLAEQVSFPGMIPREPALQYLGDLRISENATLEDLKSQAMTLPSWVFVIPSPACLRAWTVENRRPNQLLRLNQQQLRDYKPGRKTEICLEPLEKEENLGPHDMVLRMWQLLPSGQDNWLFEDLVWDTSQGCTASSLQQHVANVYTLPVEKTEIAKYFPNRLWMPLSSRHQQSTKRKKKKKQKSLQLAPYYLKDGDTIRVMNLQKTVEDDFSTHKDYVEKEKQKLSPGQKKSQAALRVPSGDISEEAKWPHGPEASLSIHVGTFR